MVTYKIIYHATDTDGNDTEKVERILNFDESKEVDERLFVEDVAYALADKKRYDLYKQVTKLNKQFFMLLPKLK